MSFVIAFILDLVRKTLVILPWILILITGVIFNNYLVFDFSISGIIIDYKTWLFAFITLLIIIFSCCISFLFIGKTWSVNKNNQVIFNGKEKFFCDIYKIKKVIYVVIAMLVVAINFWYEITKINNTMVLIAVCVFCFIFDVVITAFLENKRIKTVINENNLTGSYFSQTTDNKHLAVFFPNDNKFAYTKLSSPLYELHDFLIINKLDLSTNTETKTETTPQKVSIDKGFLGIGYTGSVTGGKTKTTTKITYIVTLDCFDKNHNFVIKKTFS